MVCVADRRRKTDSFSKENYSSEGGFSFLPSTRRLRCLILNKCSLTHWELRQLRKLASKTVNPVQRSDGKEDNKRNCYLGIKSLLL